MHHSSTLARAAAQDVQAGAAEGHLITAIFPAAQRAQPQARPPKLSPQPAYTTQHKHRRIAERKADGFWDFSVFSFPLTNMFQVLGQNSSVSSSSGMSHLHDYHQYHRAQQPGTLKNACFVPIRAICTGLFPSSSLYLFKYTRIISELFIIQYLIRMWQCWFPLLNE